MSKIVGLLLLLLLLPVLHSFAPNIKYMLKYQITKISMTMVTHNENQTVTVPRLLLRQLCRLLLRLLAACPPASFAACSSASFAACSSASFLAKLLGVGLQQGREQDCEPQPTTTNATRARKPN